MKVYKSTRRMSSGSAIAGGVFLAAGIVSFVLAFFGNFQVLGLIGLGLTFWGALFLLVSPSSYIEASVLASVVLPVYQVVDRALEGSAVAKKAYYFPSYPQEVRLPDYLKGLKDTVAFIPTNESSEMPAVEEMAGGKLYVTGAKGVLVTAPGADLLVQIENKTRIDLSKMELVDLLESFPRLVLDNIPIAKTIKLAQNQDQVMLTIVESPFLKLFNPENNLRSIGLLGCPIASAIACALAKVTGKRVFIQSLKVIPDLKTTQVIYDILEG